MLSPEHQQVLRERLAECALGRFAEEIVASARTGIRLRVTDEPAEMDDSRLGGTAALPAGVQWPLHRGEPQALIAQIVLRDVAPFDIERLLPRDGRLLFFHEESPDGPHSETVLYLPEGIPLLPRQAPAYDARRVVPSAEISLPDQDAFREMEPAEAEAYQALLETFNPDEKEPVSMLLGYSMPIHSLGTDERSLASGSRLLLQVDSEERAGMMWGDCGRLYYWIRPGDLRALRFDAVSFSEQCY